MKKWIETLIKKIGFTKTESQIILFLLAAFSIGLIVDRFKDKNANSEYLEFDYSAEDSLFNAALGNVDIEDGTEQNIIEKNIASKNESMEFGKGKKENNTKLVIESIININSAGLKELVTLPGIGNKTAENILAYRKNIGRITKAEDLLNIKGIGKAKLTKLRKHIKYD